MNRKRAFENFVWDIRKTRTNLFDFYDSRVGIERNRKEALEKLRNSASEIDFLVKSLQRDGQNRLAEYATVWCLVNFKIQEIVLSIPQEKVAKALTSFYYDLTMKMAIHRDNGMERLAELYGVAIDGFGEAQEKIRDYIGE